MIRQATFPRAAAIVAALAASLVIASLPGPQSAMAETAIARPQALAKATIQSFEADPHSLLRDYSEGGLPLSARVRALAVSDPETIKLLIALARDANDAQKAAIGAGLAEAARALARFDPAAARDIDAQIAKSGIDILVTAFIAASGPAPQPILQEDVGAGAGGPPGVVSESPAGHVFGATGSSSGGGLGVPGDAQIFGGGRAGGGGLNTFTEFSVSPSRSSM